MCRAGPARSGRPRDFETGSAQEIEEFRQRQISRMVILGATTENKPLLEESYRRMLAAFEPHVGMTSYLFGSRPSLADFAWFGQFSEMATDPTPMRIMRQLAPFTDHWVRRLDDASGVEGAWYARDRALGGMAEALLGIAGELYLPFLAANEQAFAKGVERLEINVWGCLMRWRRSSTRSNACSSCGTSLQRSI